MTAATHARAQCHASRRGVVLLVTVLAVTLAAVAAAAMLARASSTIDTSAALADRDRARSLAWSGLQAVMAELALQREDLLLGSDPTVTTRATLHETADGLGLGYRLLPVDDASADDLAPLPVIASEAARLDLNVAPAESIASLTGLTLARAQELTADRDTRPMLSPEQARTFFQAAPNADVARPIDPLALVTVFSADPNVQLGLGVRGQMTPGERRLNIAGQHTPQIAEAVKRRFGDDIARMVQSIMQGGDSQPKSEGDLVLLLGTMVDPTRDAQPWVTALDAFTTTDSLYLRGRVDIQRASERVLACLPGLDETTARQIVQERQALSDDERASPTWLVSRGLLDVDRFHQLIGHITIRSLQWRVRVEGGVFPSAEADEAVDEFGLLQNPSGSQPTQRCVLEAVIDLAGEQPRLASVRDVTMLQLARDWHQASNGSAQPMRSATPDDPWSSAEAQPTPTLDGPESSENPSLEPSPPSVPGSGPRERSEPSPEQPPRADDSPGNRASAQDRRTPSRAAGGASSAVGDTAADPRLGRWIAHPETGP